MTWHVIVQNLIGMGRLEDSLIIFRSDGTSNYKVQVVQPLELKDCSGGDFPMDKVAMTSPSFGLLSQGVAPEIRDFLQACVDCAWKLGIRASEYKDQSAEVAAVRDHLQDMRKLAKVTE